MRRSGLLVSPGLVPMVAAAMADCGQDPGPLMETLGVEPSADSGDSEPVPYETALALLERGADLTSEPAFGLLAAERYQIGANVFEYAIPNSANVAQMLERICRYCQLVFEPMVPHLEHGPDETRLVMQLREGLVGKRVLDEFCLAMPLVAGRKRGSELPARVELAYPPPAHMAHHHRVLGRTLQFDAPQNAIVFSRRMLSQRLPGSDPKLLQVLERHAEQLLQERPLVNSVCGRVQAILSQELDGGQFGIEDVASKLRMSGRTLRRRLKDEGTTHSELLDRLRADLAKRYLKDGLSVSEVTFMLGFSNLSGFHRAFRRWTDMAPEAYRKQRNHGSSPAGLPTDPRTPGSDPAGSDGENA